MIKAAAVIAIAAIASNAHADGVPLTGMFGVGAQVSGAGGYAGSEHGAAIDAALAYEVADGIALGVRGSIATPSSYPGALDYGNLPGDYQQATYSVVPFDLGITALFAHGRWWFAPWFGEHFSRTASSTNTGAADATLTTADFAMLGMTAGVELGDRLALFVDLEHNLGGPRIDDAASSENPGFQAWVAMTVGLAVRR
ncbi:MAG TPA: hypothetical protein VH143_18065 [Kofleriaceae bacterium]|jgi:hypothetical protein|nr:hypothetical protein [Kofleriaceae bacterium]